MQAREKERQNYVSKLGAMSYDNFLQKTINVRKKKVVDVWCVFTYLFFTCLFIITVKLIPKIIFYMQSCLLLGVILDLEAFSLWVNTVFM
jgi:hypothetical protein